MPDYPYRAVIPPPPAPQEVRVEREPCPAIDDPMFDGVVLFAGTAPRPITDAEMRLLTLHAFGIYRALTWRERLELKARLLWLRLRVWWG